MEQKLVPRQGSRQSELIKTMRFPLIVLVLFEHSVRPFYAPIQWSLDSVNVFHYVTEMLSHFLCAIAVCWFFFFSGFLFYRNLQEGQFGKKWVVQKWKRRIHSVVIPYLFWNLLNVAVILLVTGLFRVAGITATSDDPLVTLRQGPIYWFITGPIDYPLWYLRDLAVISLLAPIFYYPTKKWPWATLAVLLVLYFISYRSVFFLFPSFSLFGIGAWMSIRRDNLILVCRRVKYPAAILAVIFLLVATYFCNHHRSYDKLFRLIFFPFGMVTFLNVCDHLFDYKGWRNLMLRLTETVFFIYVAHEIYILGWTKGLFMRVFGETLTANWISYIFVPIVTGAVCLALFYLLKRICPKVLSFACGWRTVHKETYSQYAEKNPNNP